MSLEIQALTLFLMVVSGMALGVAFDSYRVTLNHLKVRRPYVHTVDFLYWLAATWIVFRVLFYANSGEVRVFVFLGLLLGLSMYFALLSNWVMQAVRMVIRAIQLIVQWSIRLFDLFIIRPLKLLYKCGVILFGFLAAISIFFYKIMIQLIYPIWKILIWLTKPIHRYLIWPKSWHRAWKKPIRWMRGKFGRKR